ncbi:MAG TPA: FtsX-like permease family protein [Jatrophihabitantaceae bacterium]|jgi:hypothetical protein
MAGIGVTAQALRYRAGQAVALFVLSALGIAACAFGPLYERAVEQAQLKLTVTNTPIVNRGLSVTAVSPTQSLDPFLPSGQLKRFYGEPITSTSLTVYYPIKGGRYFTSDVVSRTGMCAHLHVTSGRCPSAPGQVVVSAAELQAGGLKIGDRLPIGVRPSDVGVETAAGTLVVVGAYQTFDPHDDYWFGHEYPTKDGVQRNSDPNAKLEHADTLFAAPGFVEPIRAITEHALNAQLTLGEITEVDLALRPGRVHLNNMASLRSGVAALVAAGATRDSTVGVRTTIIDGLAEADRGRHDASSVIPAFAVELALLVLVMVGVVVVAAADQRRPEFALARLRGRSAGRAARLLDREFIVPVGLSVLPGLLLAWLGTRLACRWWLSDAARPELRWPVLAAAAAVVLVEVLVVAVVARKAARRPVHDLLRRTPQRSGRLGLGAAEAALAAVAAGGTVVALSGDRHNALAVAAPAFLALLAGLVLGRVLAWTARLAGQRALWRGRLATGIAFLQIARRPGLRYVVALLCVAVALIVSAADQWRVAGRNRSVRAGAEAGASVVLTVRAGSASTLEDAVAAGDPTGRYATPVVVQSPPSGTTVMAVKPASFGPIAAWGWSKDRPDPGVLSRLTPRRPPPITVTGTTVRLRMAQLTLVRQKQLETIGKPGPVWLTVNLHKKDGTGYNAKLGPLPEGAHGSAVLTATVPCSEGCTLGQLQLLRTTSDDIPIYLDATLDLAAGSPGSLRPISLGSASDWAEATAESPINSGTERIGLQFGGTTPTLSAFNDGSPAVMQHLDQPVAIPAMTSGNVPEEPDARGFLYDNNIDAAAASYAPIGALPVLPGRTGPAMLVDLDVAAALATSSLADSTVSVWLRTDDAARERAFVASLARNGVSVLDRDSAAAHRAILAQSAPAWAMQLALVTAVLAVLLAAIVIFISAAAVRRTWAYDMSALELVGMSRARIRRAVLVEQATAAVAGAGVGTVMGLLGAHLALPGMPLFLNDAATPQILRPIAWMTVAVAGVLALVTLVLSGALVGMALVRQVAPSRVQAGQQ